MPKVLTEALNEFKKLMVSYKWGDVSPEEAADALETLVELAFHQGRLEQIREIRADLPRLLHLGPLDSAGREEGG